MQGREKRLVEILAVMKARRTVMVRGRVPHPGRSVKSSDEARWTPSWKSALRWFKAAKVGRPGVRGRRWDEAYDGP